MANSNPDFNPQNPSEPKRVLFLSNGHGEDLNAGQVLKAFQQLCPQAEVAAMPIVGQGGAYQRLNVPIIGPTQAMPSGGIFYMNPLFLIKDLRSGLLNLAWRQVQAIANYSQTCNLIFATGDIVVVAIAYLMGRPFGVMLCAHSSYYEGRLKLGWGLEHLLHSPRCRAIFTRDRFTAEDLTQQGFTQAQFVGMPVMDALQPTEQDLALDPQRSMIALLPGSRLPEARRNFEQLLKVAIALGQWQPQGLQFWAALVPDLVPELPAIAEANGWQYQNAKLIHGSESSTVVIHTSASAFADILGQAQLVIGMAGTAIEQAVGLGKPVITLPGEGPQFTYRFAEAQLRLLGPSIQLLTEPLDSPAFVQQLTQSVDRALNDAQYRHQCVLNGQERMGDSGGGMAIARWIASTFALS
jgi:uncharacterized protein (TIGR03492 family)